MRGNDQTRCPRWHKNSQLYEKMFTMTNYHGNADQINGQIDIVSYWKEGLRQERYKQNNKWCGEKVLLFTAVRTVA